MQLSNDIVVLFFYFIYFNFKFLRRWCICIVFERAIFRYFVCCIFISKIIFIMINESVCFYEILIRYVGRKMEFIEYWLYRVILVVEVNI